MGGIAIVEPVSGEPSLCFRETGFCTFGLPLSIDGDTPVGRFSIATHKPLAKSEASTSPSFRFERISEFPGNGILRGRDSGVEKARHIQPLVSRALTEAA
jgi:hypothetical protein